MVEHFGLQYLHRLFNRLLALESVPSLKCLLAFRLVINFNPICLQNGTRDTRKNPDDGGSLKLCTTLACNSELITEKREATEVSIPTNKTSFFVSCGSFCCHIIIDWDTISDADLCNCPILTNSSWEPNSQFLLSKSSSEITCQCVADRQDDDSRGKVEEK